MDQHCILGCSPRKTQGNTYYLGIYGLSYSPIHVTVCYHHTQSYRRPHLPLVDIAASSSILI